MSSEGFVYMMFDTEEYWTTSPIYIGSTKSGEVGNSHSRFYAHFKQLKNGKMTKTEYDSVKCIRIAKVPTLADARLIERYLIGKYLPLGRLYNTQYTKEGVPTIFIDISELVFETIPREQFMPMQSQMNSFSGPSDPELSEFFVSDRSQKSGPNNIKNQETINVYWRNLLHILEKCYLIENNGSSHILYYMRGKKELIFISSEEYFSNITSTETTAEIFFPDCMADIFYSTVQWLGIPEDDGSKTSFIGEFNYAAHEYFIKQNLLPPNNYAALNVPITLNLFLNHPEQDQYFQFCAPGERDRLRKKVQHYKKEYNGIPSLDFYAVWNNEMTGSGYNAKNFISKEEAICYADAISTKTTKYKVSHITNKTCEIIHISGNGDH